MIHRVDFPQLTEQNHHVTSPPDLEYNCIAWACDDNKHWWEPGIYLPDPSIIDDYGLGVLVKLFQLLGYSSCDNDALEPGFEKVALFGSTLFYTHAARQLPDGKWTSKLGKLEDIEHNQTEDIAGGVYGEVMEIMKRPNRQQASD